MATPRSVKKQGKKAEELQQQIINGNTDNPAPDEVTDPPPADPPKADTPPDKATETPADPPSDPPKDFEHMYNVLRGKYDSEVPRLQSAMTQLQEQIKALQEKPADPPPEPKKSLLTEDQREEYGDKLVEFVQNASQDAVAKQLRDMQQTIDELRSNINGVSNTQTQTAEQIFWAAVDAKVPDFDAVNVNPEFVTWLQEIDPGTGLTRKQLLVDAHEKLDAGRVIYFFTTWKALKGASDTPPPKDPPTLPDRAGSGKPRSPDETPSFTRAQIAEFYNARRRGDYKGREEEAARIEKDIFAAQSAGTITN